MRLAALTLISSALLLTSCSRATNGASGSSASAKNGGGGGSTASNQGAGGSSQNKAGSGGASNSANGNAKGVTVPDPHQSSDPRVGREAGTGDDPANLEVGDPKENGGDSGKPGPARKP